MSEGNTSGREVRMAWQFNHYIGNTEWTLDVGLAHDRLTATMVQLERDHGQNTHWLEYRDLAAPDDVRRPSWAEKPAEAVGRST